MSMAIKYAMMKKKMARGGDVQGVHHPLRSAQGESHAGDMTRARREAEDSGRYEASGDAKSYARAEHEQVLGELKSMAGKNRRNLAEGGSVPCNAHGLDMCEECHGENKPQSGKEAEFEEHKKGYEAAGNKFDKYKSSGFAEGGEVDDMPERDDLVTRAMKSRYSKGGQVANDTPPTADFEENQFDDLVKDDDLEASYPGSSEHGDEAEDEDRRDVVSRIMKSRRLKDRMPRPA